MGAEQLLATIQQEIAGGKGKKVAKSIIDALNNTPIGQRNEIYDVIAKISSQNTEFFNKEIYYPFELELLGISKAERIDMDLYLINQYCLFEGEQVQARIYGTVMENFSKVELGRIYITPYRIIVTGAKKAEWTPPVGFFQGGKVVKEVEKKVQMGTASHFSDASRLSFGSSYSLRGAYKLRRTRSKIKLENDYEFENEKGRINRIHLSLKITPFRSANEEKLGFEQDVGEAFDTIERNVGLMKIRRG